MAIQKFYASPRDTFTHANGAIGYRPGGPMDCLGPYARVVNCPIHGTDLRLTCYATGYADSFFSVPAGTQWRGQYIGGYFTTDEHYGGIVFHPGKHAPRLQAARSAMLRRMFALRPGAQYHDLPATEITAWLARFKPLELIHGRDYHLCDAWHYYRDELMADWRAAQELHAAAAHPGTSDKGQA